MSRDRREEILVRLKEVLETCIDVGTFGGPPKIFRDRGEIPTEMLPALVLLDGSESMKVSTAGRGGARVPTVFQLEPEIFIVLRPRETIANDGVGEELSMMRMKVLKAIIYDEPLKALLGGNGELVYGGHETDLRTGNAILGAMQLRLQLTYTFDPRDL